VKHTIHKKPTPRLLVAGIIGLLCLAGMVPWARAAENWAWRVVQRSVPAGHDVPHQGYRTVVMFQQGQKVAGFIQKVSQDHGGQQRVVVVEPPDQRGRTEICDGQTCWEYYPRVHKVIVSHASEQHRPGFVEMLATPGSSSRLGASYLGDEHMAGRLAHIIELTTPAGRPVCKLWVDHEKFIQLKVQRFCPRGTITYSAYFTTITYEPKFSPDLFTFTPPEDARIVRVPPALPRVDLKQAERQAGFSAKLPRYVPEGYQLERSRVAVARMRGQLVLWLPFSNGVDRFSLFQGPRGLNMRTGRQRLGECWVAGPFSFALVGSLPVEEVEKIKESIPK